MTDDQIEEIKIQREVDKLDDLRIESVTLPSPDGEDTDELAPQSPPDIPMPGEEPDDATVELADSDNMNKSNLKILAEPDFTRFSVDDDSSPIKAQEKVDNIAKSLGLPISEDKEHEDKGRAKREKRKKGYSFTDHLAMVQEDPDDDELTSSKTRRYKEASKNKTDANPALEISRELNNASKLPSVYESDDSYMSNYVNKKMEFSK